MTKYVKDGQEPIETDNAVEGVRLRADGWSVEKQTGKAPAQNKQRTTGH